MDQRSSICESPTLSHLPLVRCALCPVCCISSYRPVVFAKAARILRKRAILNERTIVRFETLLGDLATVSESMQALDVILGDIPDEFADALMGTIMTDPVQLPQSKQMVDRATIHRQLMNKRVDPFSNTPLTQGHTHTHTPTKFQTTHVDRLASSPADCACHSLTPCVWCVCVGVCLCDCLWLQIN